MKCIIAILFVLSMVVGADAACGRGASRTRIVQRSSGGCGQQMAKVRVSIFHRR